MNGLVEQTELPTIEPARAVTPMDLMDKAVQHGMGADELEKLLALQERYEASQAKKAFSAALAGFQAAVPTIQKNKQADRYTYASFDEIMRTIKPFLSTAGLSVRFTTEMSGDDIITATCTVTHCAGHSESSHFAAPVDSQMRVNNTQKMGSANSYAKRYCLVNALNLSVSDDADDDGGAAGTAYITEEQVITIQDHIDSIDGWDEDKTDKFLVWLKADEFEYIHAADFERAVNFLKRKAK
jgi:hypothetical protein